MSSATPPSTEPSWLLSMRRGKAAVAALVSVAFGVLSQFGVIDADPTALTNVVMEVISGVLGLVAAGYAAFSAFRPNNKQAVTVVAPPTAPPGQ